MDLERQKKTLQGVSSHTAMVVGATKNGTGLDTERTTRCAILLRAVAKRRPVCLPRSNFSKT